MDELVKRFEAARKAGEHERGNREQLRLLRELAEECPAFTPNLLYLARVQQVIDQPGRNPEEVFSEIQRLLELAILGSNRGAPVILELGNFLDTFQNDPLGAMKLYEEGEQKALAILEDAWFFKLRYWNLERTKESLEKALRLCALVEQVFPEPNTYLEDEIQTTKRLAALEGLLPDPNSSPG
ncbi:MAG TPA: hypothetical protein VFZ09_46310 [Archangium sp.]|uniref:hypothetical protein n=1 Tax=Archangium sp. TaxID=1872627 RepID=UPI002E37B68C|nr:hypothetical protein [Archangium sp.]HEX5753692.1 hypothetical protein [Archangium sp.]